VKLLLLLPPSVVSLIKSQKYLEGRAIKLMDQSMKLVVMMGFSLDDEASLPDSRPLPLAAEIEI
jgi:hypothetical protein